MKLILCGGGSGEKNVLFNEKLNQIINHDYPILYIPLAMDEKDHPYDGCYQWILQELSNVEIPYIEMVRSFEELSKKDLFSYSALFIGGGNTYKLLKGLKSSGVFQKINEYIHKDGIVIGGSAGAVIFGYDINVISAMDKNEVELTDTLGFNVLLGASIFPHYTNKKTKLTEAENEERFIRFTNSIKDFSKLHGPVIAIPEEDAIYIEDTNIEMLGTKPYYVVENGVIEEKNINSMQRK